MPATTKTRRRVRLNVAAWKPIADALGIGHRPADLARFVDQEPSAVWRIWHGETSPSAMFMALMLDKARYPGKTARLVEFGRLFYVESETGDE